MPTIEPEGELIKVIVEVLMLNTALVSAVQPSLEKRSCHMDSRQDLMRQLGTTADDDDLMLVTGLLQIRITTPSVGAHDGTGGDGFLDKGKEAVPRDVDDAPETNAADAASILLGRHSDDGLGFCFAALRSLFRTADIGFVDLDSPGEAFPPRPANRPAQLVEPSPGRFIASQSEHPLQAQGADAVLLACHKPHRKEPHPQRLTCALEHRVAVSDVRPWQLRHRSNPSDIIQGSPIPSQ